MIWILCQTEQRIEISSNYEKESYEEMPFFSDFINNILVVSTLTFKLMNA